MMPMRRNCSVIGMKVTRTFLDLDLMRPTLMAMDRLRIMEMGLRQKESFLGSRKNRSRCFRAETRRSSRDSHIMK